ILPALAAVGLPAQPVESNGNRLVRLRRERAVRHGTAGEPLHDRLDGLDVVERHGRSGRDELEQVARLDRGSVVHELAEPRVAIRATVPGGGPQRVSLTDRPMKGFDDLGARGVRLSALAELVETRIFELGLDLTG